jgi:hypothetical protein
MPSSKKVRLERLSALTSSVPRTFWSVESFAAAKKPDTARWVVRNDSVATTQAGLPTAEAFKAASGLKGEIVIQEFIESCVTGVTFVRDNEMLCEAIDGPCSSILRNGGRGTRWACESSGKVLWVSGPKLDDQLVSDLARSQNDALRTMRLMRPASMLEWMMALDGTLYWVDLKILSDSYISDFCPNIPSTYVVGRAEPQKHSFIPIPSTNLQFRKHFSRLFGAGVFCDSGSPLAHLCVAAYEQHVPLIVREC